jgi:ADP-heptose:LPS heptosyltransferase
VSAPDRVLIIKLSALGDMILAFPAFTRIRKAHAGAHLTLLTTPAYAELAACGPWFDAVDPTGRPRSVAGTVDLVRRLRRARFDRVYDLQGVDRTNFYRQLLRPRPPQWSGVAFGCDLPHRNRARMRMHTLERQAEQLAHAGIWPDAPVAAGEAPAPDVGWLADQAQPLALPPGDLALIAPGAAPSRPRKRWPAPLYGELAERLAAEGLTPAVVGSAAEREIAEEILVRAPKTLDLVGRTDLAQLAWLGGRARLAVGNDTGPMHILAAAGAPCVSLFSDDSDPDLCAPRGRVSILREGDLARLEVARVVETALSASRRPRGAA